MYGLAIALGGIVAPLTARGEDMGVAVRQDGGRILRRAPSTTSGAPAR
jgi:hypothetical protein